MSTGIMISGSSGFISLYEVIGSMGESKECGTCLN